MFLFLLNKTYMLPDVLYVFMHAEAAEVQVHSRLHPGSAQVTMAWRPMGRWDLWDESPVMFVGVGPYGSTIV